MDWFAGLVRSALEQGWRLGSILFLAGGLVLIAHRFDLPGTGVLAEWLGWASISLIVGIALLITSVLIKLFERIEKTAQRRQARSEARSLAQKEERDVLANLSTLTNDERRWLISLLKDGGPRFQIGTTSDAYSLIDKGLLVWRGSTGSYALCELHPVIVKQRDDLLRDLEQHTQ